MNFLRAAKSRDTPLPVPSPQDSVEDAVEIVTQKTGDALGDKPNSDEGDDGVQGVAVFRIQNTLRRIGRPKNGLEHRQRHASGEPPSKGTPHFRPSAIIRPVRP